MIGAAKLVLCLDYAKGDGGVVLGDFYASKLLCWLQERMSQNNGAIF
jgi:hypothetical protein